MLCLQSIMSHRPGCAGRSMPPCSSEPLGPLGAGNLISGSSLPTVLMAVLRQVWLHPWWQPVAEASQALSLALISRASGHSSGKTLHI